MNFGPAYHVSNSKVSPNPNLELRAIYLRKIVLLVVASCAA